MLLIAVLIAAVDDDRMGMHRFRQGLRRLHAGGQENLTLGDGAVEPRGFQQYDQYDSMLSSIYGVHNPYQDFQPRPIDLQGWGNHFELYAQVVKKLNPSLIVEVGVWKGASTCSFAKALRRQGKGVVVAVDTWLGAIEFWTHEHRGYRFNEADRAARNLRFVHGWPTVFYTFLSNVVQQELQRFVVPFPAASNLAQKFFKSKAYMIDVIHIDASHEYDDVKADLHGWWGLVRPGGVLIGDDYNHPGFPGVTQAVDEFAKAYEVSVEHSPPKWVIWKPHPKIVPGAPTP